jgi:plastocyanin
MRLLTIPLAFAATLALAAPASAADGAVTIGDEFFKEKTVQIQPGDSVKWTWTGEETHTVTANPNQTLKFGSREQSSGSFSQTFAKPGRFLYHCEIHPDVMKGVVEVGAAPFPDTSLPRVTKAKASTRGTTATLRFKLSEKAKIKVKVTGAARKSVTKTLRKGSRSVKLRGLKDGRYRASITATDAAGNKGKAAKAKFRISD